MQRLKVVQLPITPNMIRSIISTAPVPNTRILFMKLSTKLIVHLFHLVCISPRQMNCVITNLNRSNLGAPSIGWNIPAHATPSSSNVQQSATAPPPLPPRNTIDTNDLKYGPANIISAAQQQQRSFGERPKVSTKLYENVVTRKTYDPELVAFYNMVKVLRAQYVHTDTATNVGHVVAAEFSNLYPEETSIKLLVHPSIACLKSVVTAAAAAARPNSGPSSNVDGIEKGQIDGYGPPVVFTCDSKFNSKKKRAQNHHSIQTLKGPLKRAPPTSSVGNGLGPSPLRLRHSPSPQGLLYTNEIAYEKGQ